MAVMKKDFGMGYFILFVIVLIVLIGGGAYAHFVLSDISNKLKLKLSNSLLKLRYIKYNFTKVLYKN